MFSPGSNQSSPITEIHPVQDPDTMQGIDLATDPSTRSERHRQVYSEEDHEGNVLWSLRTADMKLISANADNRFLVGKPGGAYHAIAVKNLRAAAQRNRGLFDEDS